MKAFIDVSTDGQIQLRGDLNFSSIAMVWQDLQPRLKNLPHYDIDTKDLNYTDSAGLALLVELYRQAKERHIPISFKNISPQLEQLAKVCGLEVLLTETRV